MGPPSVQSSTGPNNNYMSELNKLKMRKDALLSSKGLTAEEEQVIDRVAA